jgi:hypothetical protein
LADRHLVDRHLTDRHFAFKMFSYNSLYLFNITTHFEKVDNCCNTKVPVYLETSVACTLNLLQSSYDDNHG